MKSNYLIHWYGSNKIVQEYSEYEDVDYSVIYVDSWCVEDVLEIGEQYFERLWNQTEDEVKQFADNIKREYRTDKCWYSEI